MDELDSALKKLKKGKGRDAKGIVAEMYKAGGKHLRLALLHCMNDALHPSAAHPSKWKKTRITVLFKSGDASQAKNYRPISVIPALYKLFSVKCCYVWVNCHALCFKYLAYKSKCPTICVMLPMASS